jgi:ABC-2 type transport system permease protein
MNLNLSAGWMLVRRTWASWLQSRSFFYILAFGWMVGPLIYLFVWSTAAGSATINGWTRGEFVAYYLILINVSQLTVSQATWTVGMLIQMGSMNRLLLYPMPPIYDAIASEVAGKVVYMTFVIPVTAALALWLRPTLAPTPAEMGLFGVALALAWALRFFWGYAMALSAFWWTRADALVGVQESVIFLLAGQIAPTALLPGVLGTLAVWLPFRYMLGFPVEILMGQLTPVQLQQGFGLQLAWLALALLASRFMWRQGVRHYVAVGG